MQNVIIEEPYEFVPPVYSRFWPRFIRLYMPRFLRKTYALHSIETRGADRLTTYKLPSAQFFTQVFCRDCGSALPRVDPDRKLAFTPMGSLDDDPGMRPERHIFVDSKAPWYAIADELPQYPQGPPPA